MKEGAYKELACCISSSRVLTESV